MDRTSSDKSQAGRFHVVYGWSEGPWQGRKICHALETAGFKETSSLGEADIIIAHSMGCYLIPETSRTRLIILIGVPYWPGKPAFWSVLQNTRANLVSSYQDHSAWWLNKLAHNLAYILTRPSATYQAMRYRSSSRLPSVTRERQVVLIRNRSDTFCHPEIQDFIPETSPYTLLSMPAERHEDCWHRPQAYVEVVERLYG